MYPALWIAKTGLDAQQTRMSVIANNLVAGAATGIEVTNFNDGGRLATVQGNVIRELFRREAEPIDKRGVGIAVEADTAVSGNTMGEAICGRSTRRRTSSEAPPLALAFRCRESRAKH